MRVMTRGNRFARATTTFWYAFAAILKALPKSGPLFPMKAFIRRRTRIGVQGVTLHSYRYV